MTAWVLGVDGGNSKTDLAVMSTDGAPVALVRGPGTNSHATTGAEGAAAVVRRLLAGAAQSAGLQPAEVERGVQAAVLYCCGADMPEDIEALSRAFSAWLPAERLLVDNDTFALLSAGRHQRDAVAVVCGAGINCVGQSGAGATVRYPGLGWESGDWGGSEMLGREALFLAARARDGRGEPSVLPRLIEEHFGLPLDEVGAAMHYRRLPVAELGQLAPEVVAAAEHDTVAAGLVARLAREIALLARRALSDLGALGRPADVVLGGGMLVAGGRLVQMVAHELAELAPLAEPAVCGLPPVIGAVGKALELSGVPAVDRARLWSAFGSLSGPPAMP